MTFETVDFETPLSAATSLIVGRLNADVIGGARRSNL
jgi:hypothetical protein